MIEIPGYKIIKELGQGGMATVYLANHLGLEREVALKVMSPLLMLDPSFTERFNREAKIVAKLKHPGIVVVYDVGQLDNINYISMEYHANGDLKDRITQGLCLKDCLFIIKSVAMALDFAHAKGYVHRDIKPENILFDDQQNPVITDFGIAKCNESSTQVTQVGSAVGTPRYMSPEQARGKKTDHRSDLYSLGVIFYEMLAGKVPYEADDSLAIGIKHVTEPIPSLPEAFSAFQGFLNKAMAKQPISRFQSGRDFAQALELNPQSGAGDDAIDFNSPIVTHEDDRPYYPNARNNSQGTMIVPPKKSILPKVVVSLVMLVIATLAFSYLQPGYMPLLDTWVNEISGRAQQQRNEQALADKQQQFKESVQLLENQAMEQVNSKDVSEANLLKAMVFYQQLQKIDPKNQAIQKGLQSISHQYLQLAEKHADQHDFYRAQNAINEAKKLNYEPAEMEQVQKIVEAARLDYAKKLNDEKIQQEVARQLQLKLENEQMIQQKNIEILLQQAKDAVTAQRLTQPENSALFYYQKVLLLDDSNPDAKKGLDDLINFYVTKTQSDIARKHFISARKDLEKIKSINKNYEGFNALDNQLAQAQESYNQQQKALALNNETKSEVKASLSESSSEKTSEMETDSITQKIDSNENKASSDPLLELRVNALLKNAKEAILAGRIAPPSNNNAFEKYLNVLSIQSGNQEAKAGIETILADAKKHLKGAQGDEVLTLQYQESYNNMKKLFDEAFTEQK